MESKETNRLFKIEPLLGGFALLLLLIGCFFVLKPFMAALMWAIILAYSLHPLQRRFTRWFRGSRTLAACFVTLTLTVVLAGPIVLIGFSIAQDGKDLAEATRKWFLAAPEKAPAWIADAPLIGSQLADYWASISEDRNRWIEQLEKQVKTAPRLRGVAQDGDELTVQDALPLRGGEADAEAVVEKKNESAHIVTLLGKFLVWAKSGLIAVGLAVWAGVTQVVFSAFLAFFLLRDAPVLSERLGNAVERLAGERGQHLIKVAGGTVRGVIYGILGTAIAQALVAGLGFWIAGLPGAVLLSVLTFFFAVIPFGPPLIWLPATFWLWAQGKPGMAIFMVLWGALAISSVDNFLRPYLISQNSKMPFVLIFCGVIGGALAFGLVGVFMGPTMLAVAFRLIEEWSAERSLRDRPGDGLSAPRLESPPAELLKEAIPHGSGSLGTR
jgi:predicted PurR-regulated permease PerM